MNVPELLRQRVDIDAVNESVQTKALATEDHVSKLTEETKFRFRDIIDVVEHCSPIVRERAEFEVTETGAIVRNFKHRDFANRYYTTGVRDIYITENGYHIVRDRDGLPWPIFAALFVSVVAVMTTFPAWLAFAAGVPPQMAGFVSVIGFVAFMIAALATDGFYKQNKRLTKVLDRYFPKVTYRYNTLLDIASEHRFVRELHEEVERRIKQLK